MKIIAAFDFDGTITTKDTLWEFLKFTQKRWKLVKGLFLLSPVLFLYKIKVISNDYAKEKLFSHFFKGWDQLIFENYCIAFSEIIDSILRKSVLDLIKKYQKENLVVMIISASVENWILPWAEANDIEIVLATQIEIDASGRLSGKFRSRNCYGMEKVNRLTEVYPDRNNYYLYAYGDSKGDKALIDFADEGFYIQNLK